MSTDQNSHQSEASAPERTLVARACDLVKTVGELKDGFLFTAGFVATSVYLCGFMVWAIHAWQHELGMFPVLDAQYFLAGIFPALILFAFGLFLRSLVPLYQWLLEDTSERAKKVGVVIDSVGGVFLVAGVAGCCFLTDRFRLWGMGVLSVGLLFLLASAFFRRDKVAKVFQGYYVVLGFFLVAFIAAYLILQFTIDWFPNLPQEFGGTSPRLIQFDLDASQLSPASRQLCLPEQKETALTGVQRSRDLHLIFDGGEFMLVKTVDGKFFKIRKGAVLAVFPGGQ